MTKQVMVGLILASMSLHCASKLGLLDRLYQKRQDIAYALGLIQEAPISMCSSDYDFGRGLKIESKDYSHFPLLPQLTQSRDIDLFFVSGYSYRQQLQVPHRISLINPIDLYGLLLIRPIFHPPSA